MRPIACRIAIILTVALSATPPATASNLAFLSGIVRLAGRPAGGAEVVATGNNVERRTTSGADGRFAFPPLPLGSYTVRATGGGRVAVATVDLSSEGTSVALELHDLHTIGSTSIVAHPAAPALRGSGTDLTLDAGLLSHAPQGSSFPDLLVQLPGAARGANGVVHLNGDHGDIDYIVDGVPIPQELNRIVGTEFDPADAAYVEVLEGAYPAQYGNRFASVVNISTRSGRGAPQTTLDVAGGSFGSLDSTLGFHRPLGAGTLVAAFHAQRSDAGLDAPSIPPVHDGAAATNAFVRITEPVGNDFFNATLSRSYATYQVPNDLAGGEPAATDDNETQSDLFGTLQFHHAIGDRGALTFAASYKQSTIRDFPDAPNDWTYARAVNRANGAGPSDCANALSAPQTFSTTTCGYALYGNRTAYDYPLSVDEVLSSAVHQVRWGLSYDTTVVPKNYAITLQPNNFLARLYDPATPHAPYTVVDDNTNTGQTQGAYAQDTWTLGRDYALDYGLRFDTFVLESSDIRDGASMFSPRLKLTRFFGTRANVYAYFGRFFTPFSFENVAPSAAYLLNLPLERSIASFDLRPQRDSVYELGGHLPLGSGDLGVRVMQKNATDLIDDTQVGLTNLHQDINYAQGRIATQTLSFQQPLLRGGRAYVSFNHTYSVNKGCETQLLAPCFGSPEDWTPADHMQQWGATGGFVANDARGGWLSLDAEYGSGLSSDACAPQTPGFCSYTPHLTFDILKGFVVGGHTIVTLGIDNLLNDRYFVTFQNAQGNHIVAGRRFLFGVRLH